MYQSRIAVCCFTLAVLVVRPTAAQDATGALTHPAPVARVTRVQPGAITIDGRLDEAEWASAEPVTSFTQADPKEGEPATQRTDVRILIDGEAIYFGARMFESDPAKLRPRLARRDEPVDGDVLAITLDSRHDHVSGYFFRITAGGAVRDAVATQGGDDVSLDLTWDAVWEAKTSIDAQGWIAEIRIPLSQIPYNRDADPVWGIQIERFRWNEFEQDFFAFTLRREGRGLQRYGHLMGLGQLPAPSRIELLPYVTTRGEYRIVDADNPFRSGDDYFADAGLDLKYRLTSNVTVNATFNPDFGQVEVDPAVVNLTQFETFFPERRPFFIEGRELFRFGQIRTYNSYGFPTVFFSRRIGRTPQGGIGGDTIAHVDVPDQSTILGAAKITGKTAQGWSLGMLEAVTGEENAEFLTRTNVRGKVIVEPLTNYFVGRAGREMRRGNTLAGAYVSAVNRRLEDDVLASFLRRAAYAGGVDLQQTWSNRTWALDASLLASHVSGTREAILATQTAPARYYQRPDAESFRVDPGRTSLAGLAGQIALTKLAGAHWLGNVAWQHASPGFEVNDIGFQNNADRRAFSTDFFYRETKAGKRFRNYAGGVFTNQTWNADGDIVFNNYAAFLDLSFLNFSGLSLRYDLSADSYDDRLTRGGPVVRSLHGWSGQVNWFSDQRKRAFGNINVFHDSYASGATSTSVSTNVNWSPSPTVSLVAGPQWFRGSNPAQFRRIEGGGPAATYGQRYIFAELEQREVSMTARVNWTFSPTLSLQTFVQPLVSAGDFGPRKQLRAARTFDFDPVAGNDDASDFNFRSLRGNAVLRWEYRPGSTLYLVWQQFRSGLEPFGDFRFGRDVRGVVGSRPENVVAIKVTYWLPL
jgi:uncharacterized protein DUF5916